MSNCNFLHLFYEQWFYEFFVFFSDFRELIGRFLAFEEFMMKQISSSFFIHAWLNMPQINVSYFLFEANLARENINFFLQLLLKKLNLCTVKVATRNSSKSSDTSSCWPI